MSQPYNVFISWSGERSKLVAQKLREWLPRVIQTARPWLSDTDSPENLDTPWLLFEGGAISKAIDDSSRLCTYLLGDLKPEDVKPPLGMFQATRATKDDTRKLVETINLSLSEEPLADDDLDEIFEAMWPSLEATIRTLPLVQPTKSFKRNLDDMVAEILEIVRSDANRRQIETKRLQPPVGLTSAQVEALIAGVQRKQKFVAELLHHARRWELEHGELRIFFTKEKRSFAEMLGSKDAIGKIRFVAKEVLGTSVEVVFLTEAAPETLA